jgi:hypothetical protein
MSRFSPLRPEVGSNDGANERAEVEMKADGSNHGTSSGAVEAFDRIGAAAATSTKRLAHSAPDASIVWEIVSSVTAVHAGGLASSRTGCRTEVPGS